MTTISQFLGNRLCNYQRPLLVNGCIDTYSRSNKYSLRDNETTPTVRKGVLCSVGEELSQEQDSRQIQKQLNQKKPGVTSEVCS
jgi:hypothetical protein